MTSHATDELDSGNRLRARGTQRKLTTPMPRSSIIVLVFIGIAIASYFVRVGQNPPGYYIDEASISYNAYTISQTGRDEFDTPWPLYFRAFGDYKNPVYIYLLAAIYRFTGPSVTAARLFSAALGVLGALAIGLLAWRVTAQREVALLVTLLALLTPWLFEVSRVVLEVSLYPLVLSLFLLCVYCASQKPSWSWTEILSLAVTLSSLTYTYSIGRLIGPLLALGLVCFVTRARLLRLRLSWGLYVVMLIPIFIFQRQHPDALYGRFSIITYITPQNTRSYIAWEFIKHYFGNLNPWRLLVTGDPNQSQITHLYGSELLLAAGGLLSVAGLLLILRFHFRNAWWRFVIYGLAVSVVPASLTHDYVHTLRLIPFAVFMMLLTFPALEWLMKESRPVILSLLILLIVSQGALFQWRFHASADTLKRRELFDNGYPSKIFFAAVAAPNRPIYLADALAIPGYIQAYWNAALRGVPKSTFVRLAPDEAAQEGALVISTEENCPRCQTVATSEFYTLYVAKGQPPKREPLPDGGFRAALTLVSAPNTVRAGEQVKFRVRVKNESNSLWLARERSGGRHQVSLGNHWLDHQGKTFTGDDGRAALLSDLKPGEEVELNLAVNAPKRRGDYILEFDMVQEGVSWFGLKGSPTVRIPLRIE